MLKSYVYNGKEVILTGREAERKLKSGKFDKLYEIRPIDADGTSRKYNSWVKMTELFEITSEFEEDE